MFSVLICTYNRHDILGRALRSVIQDTTEKPDQVVVVNGGDERADAVVESFAATAKAAGIELKLVETVNKNVATSRNIGFRHSTGDILAMTDDDAEVFPDWVAQMKHAHREHPEAGAVGGEVLGTNTRSLAGKVADVVTFPTWKGACTVRTLPAVNISYKRAVLDLVGEQDVTLFRGEDVDFNWRVQKAGYTVFFDPAIKVYHYHRPTLRGFLNQHYMYGRAYLLVRRKWPDLYCVYPHGFRRPKDLLKAANFVASMFYLPLKVARRLPRLRDRVMALPVLFSVGVVWRAGLLVQAMDEMGHGR